MGGAVGASRYTFLVCSKCGVQSPPFFVTDPTRQGLHCNGWQWTMNKYSTDAVCPKCQEDAKED